MSKLYFEMFELRPLLDIAPGYVLERLLPWEATSKKSILANECIRSGPHGLANLFVACGNYFVAHKKRHDISKVMIESELL